MHTRQHLCEGEEGGVIGHKAGGEEECSILLVKVSQFLLQFNVEFTGARDVPGTSCP